MASVPASPTPTIPARRERVFLRGLADLDVPADVVETGQGRPVVFLHGLVGLNDHWEDVVQRIAHRCRCVLLQLPLLDLKDDDCSIDGATALTARFLDRFRTEKPVIVGNSFGGHVALRLAVEQPDLLGGLVLAGSSGLIEKSMVSDIQLRPSREWLTRKIGELFHDKAKMNPADVERAYLELNDRAHARAMVRLSRTARRNHLGDEMHRITCPTLIVWGKQDIVTPPEAATEMNARIRGSRLVWFEQCGHAPMIEAAEPFGEAMLAFLDDLDARG
ncbi:MAG: alpha/beta hydrolase [Phycisphaerae bacterium]|nr:MAG: alpha/beta hydrolase [Phycisphaerae bacterium]